ncbi:hypothetical protein COC42_04225 [Sphingomonas spermidinifaciens]|uniref:Lipoprotein n=1 Tax=Sphingomonas spermidinifaciens TaxID=1141889 RepID=A0A2A4B715_9SPHN|nr:hypothetical protein [Sphingomonas spermidinifaciens]PCD03579.1 hypothetical protein COC42_04225 [Sphingomonas spermidinifaciens]
MADFKRLSLILLTSCAGATLAACDGASSVASPGEGGIVLPTPAPTPAPTPTPTPTSTAGTPAADCPTGTTNVGTVGNFRSCRLPSVLTSNLTLPRRAGTAYEINGRVDVGIDRGASGTVGTAATLTIEPGVLIYANTTNTDNDFLVVNRGSTINADGLPDAPIIFTAQQNLTGTIDETAQGLWGGVIIAGRAPVSNCNLSGATGGSANCENVVEGTGNALYGGGSPGDNSGVMRYVQIRYSGTVISPNNELQGLTTGGVGTGTRLEYIQIHNSSDDGIEIFGGTHNLRYLVVTGADDDSVDTDVGWKGFLQFVIAIQKPNNSQTDNFLMEIDSNNNEDVVPRQTGRIANFTFIHTSTSSGSPAAIRLRGGADFSFVNGIVTSSQACLNIIAGTDANGGKSTIRPANPALDEAGPPVFNSVYFACNTLSATTTVNSVTVTNDEQAAVVAAGSNNVTNGTAANAYTSTYLPGSGATAVTPFNNTSLNPSGTSFLVPTSYIGAISGSSDNWYRGWTCNSNAANFGSTSGNCTTVPVT